MLTNKNATPLEDLSAPLGFELSDKGKFVWLLCTT